ncbi:MAG: HEAT repeat domain-containing protein, partial [Terriglobia bacterium]
QEEWFTDLFRDVKAADPELQKALKSSVPEGKKWVFERISKELGKAVSEAAAQPKLDPTKDRLPSALSNLSESTASSIEPINVEETDMLLQPGALTQYTEVNLSDSAVAAEVAATVLEMLPFSEVAETREKSMRVLEESVGSFNDPEALCDILIGIDDMVRATMQGDAYKEMLENLYAGLIKSDALNLIIQAGSQADLRPKGGRALRILGSAALQPIIERIIRSGSDTFRANTSALLDETGWDYCTKIGNRMRGSNTTLAKNAATVLGLIGTEEALRLLHTALDQASPRLAPTILRAIGNHDSDAATNILAEALSGNSQHRELAAKVLAGRPDSRAHTILCDFVAARIIKNRDMAARKAAIIAMSEADSAEFDKCLQQMIRTTRVLWGKQWETLKTVAGQELARKTSKTVAGTNQ